MWLLPLQLPLQLQSSAGVAAAEPYWASLCMKERAHVCTYMLNPRIRRKMETKNVLRTAGIVAWLNCSVLEPPASINTSGFPGSC